ncbi:unnamed protein product [Rhizophagus irregularis]|nr:unnamed protein product [Rhizophagus irregularis]
MDQSQYEFLASIRIDSNDQRLIANYMNDDTTEGGFSIIYKAIWSDGIRDLDVAVKKLSDSQNIKYIKYVLNELKSLYHFYGAKNYFNGDFIRTSSYSWKNSFNLKQEYITKEYEFDINNIKSSVQSSFNSRRQNSYISKPFSKLVTTITANSSRKHNIEELNIETQNNRKHTKTDNSD